MRGRVCGPRAGHHAPLLALIFFLFAFVVGLFLAGLLPLVALDFTMRSGGRATAEEVDPSILMDSINLHLSRDLPAPMEPIMVRESGGIQ